RREKKKSPCCRNDNKVGPDIAASSTILAPVFSQTSRRARRPINLSRENSAWPATTHKTNVTGPAKKYDCRHWPRKKTASSQFVQALFPSRMRKTKIARNGTQ